MDELVAFLRAALDRDELLIREAAEDYFYFDGHGDAVNRWFDRWSPDNPGPMLSDVQAKRRILDDYDILVGALQRIDNLEDLGTQRLIARREARESDIRALAQPYAGQPGWREEWQLSAPA